MYIGCLNEKYKQIEFKYFKKNLKKVPKALVDGNPFLGEPLQIHFDELTSNGLDLYVKLSDTFLINNVVIYFGEKSAPYGVALYDAEKKKCYSEYRAETGCNITKRVVALAAECELNEFVIEFDADFSHINLDKIEIFGADFEGEKILPIPTEFKSIGGEIAAELLTSASFDTEDGEAAFLIFAEKMDRKYDLDCRADENGFLRFMYDANEKANGYSICIEEDHAKVSACDRKGFVQAAETLIKLITNAKVPLCKISDAPFCEFRGVHLFLPAEDQMDFAKRLIRDILSPMGYNFIIMQFSAAMELEKHPEINEGFLEAIAKSSTGEWPTFPHHSVGGGKLVSKDSVRDLIAYSREFGIDVVPEIQSLGHVQYMTLSHPEIAEIPEEVEAEVIDERVADVRPKTFYKHSACPSNPKTYELLFDICDEIIEVVQPREYVHMGHDEVYEIGVCPICKHKDPADLLAYDLNRIHDYLASKGLKMMIWADMLQNCTKYKTFTAIDKIPKDILLLDFIWYFHIPKDIENFLLENEFEVLFGNMYSSHFPRYETRIRKKGIRGGQLSSWVKTAEDEMGREGKLYDFIYTGLMLWSEQYSSYNRFSYDRIISDQLPFIRSDIQNISYPSMEASAEKTAIIRHSVLSTDPTKYDSDYSVNGKFRSLVFEHASSDYLRRLCWVSNKKIGSYRVCYEDGTEIVIPLTYGDNICHWDRRQNEPFGPKYYRHNGYCATWFVDSERVLTDFGKEGTVYKYEWINPSPDKTIDRIVLDTEKDIDTGICVYSICGIK